MMDDIRCRIQNEKKKELPTGRSLNLSCCVLKVLSAKLEIQGACVIVIE